MREVPVTQARADLAMLVNEVAYRNERIALTRHGRIVAILVPPEVIEVDSDAEIASVQFLDTSGSEATLRPAAHAEPGDVR